MDESSALRSLFSVLVVSLCIFLLFTANHWLPYTADKLGGVLRGVDGSGWANALGSILGVCVTVSIYGFTQFGASKRRLDHRKALAVEVHQETEQCLEKARINMKYINVLTGLQIEWKLPSYIEFKAPIRDYVVFGSQFIALTRSLRDLDSEKQKLHKNKHRTLAECTEHLKTVIERLTALESLISRLRY